jgi:cell division protein ZapA
MSHVTVTIAGRAYRMACDEGQEEHLLGLGRHLDEKMDQLRSSFGEIGDMRLAVMAGIMVTDELAEARRQLEQVRREAETLREARSDAERREEQVKNRVVYAIGEAAGRIEKLADSLHRGSN